MKILIVSVLLLTLTGCTSRIKNDKFVEAVEKCKNNDGVFYMRANEFFGSLSVYCNNGAIFDIRGK